VEPQRKRIGRPPRIDLAAIADAALEIGFEEATMRRVAEHLGVSVPGLYHYVKGRDDLLRVAAERAIARVELPEDRGQHWAEWLRAWAHYIRGALGNRPELVEHFVTGGLEDDRLLEVIGQALDVLCREGFEPPQALAAWEAVSTMALGSAVEDIRERTASTDGRPWIARVFAVLAKRPPEAMPTLRSLAAEGRVADRDEAFEERITTVLVGLAVRHDLPVDHRVLGTPKPRSRRRG
jgi:AcrR family transcriptional regulator